MLKSRQLIKTVQTPLSPAQHMRRLMELAVPAAVNTAGELANTANQTNSAANLAATGVSKLARTGGAVAKGAGTVGKFAGRLIPGLGAAAGAYDAAKRAEAGDYTGAGISAASGAASTVPVWGTAVALGGAAAQAVRDKLKYKSFFPDYEEIKAYHDKEKTPAAGVNPQTAAPTSRPPVVTPDPGPTSRPPVVTPRAGEGVTGSTLATHGISRDQRRDQQFVDSQLGAGKYTAGSAASNLALLANANAKAEPAAGEEPVQTAESASRELYRIVKLSGLSRDKI